MQWGGGKGIYVAGRGDVWYTGGRKGENMRFDCHMHMILDGTDYKKAIGRHSNGADVSFIRRTLEAYQRLGYGYLRDGGDRWGAGKMARSLAGEYGICYRTPLSPLCKRGHYGGFIGEVYENFREYGALVEKQRRDGADFIKIMISGLMDFNRFGVLTEEGLSAGEIRELIHIAHEEGFAVMAHANGARTVQAAAEAGVDSVEHGAYLDTEALAAMAAGGVVWVPTLSAIGNLQGKGRFEEDAVKRILDSSLANVAAYGEMGGLVACGSDAGAWAVTHNCDTEMDWLRQALGSDAEALTERGNLTIASKF